MNYETSNGILSLMGGTRPIPGPINRENVSHDIERLQQDYDIISVLPVQRYSVEKGLIYPQGLKSCKRTKIEIGLLFKCYIHSQAE